MTSAHVTPTASGAIPYLTIPARQAREAIELYRAAFGAEELLRTPAEDGERVLHSRLSINGGLVFISDEFPEYGHESDVVPKGVVMHLQVDDADAWWTRAIAAGCTPIKALENQFWGDRYGRMRDPFGHIWSVGAPIAK